MSAFQDFGDLLTVVGALLLFFNWVATNIVTERFKVAKAAYSAASETTRLYRSLNSIRGSIESVASETLNTSRDLYRFDRRQNEELDSVPYIENELLWMLSTSSLNARQIDWGIASCELQVEQSEVDEIQTGARDDLKQIYAELTALKAEKDAIFKQANSYVDAVRSKRAVTDADIKRLRDILRSYSRDLLPRFRPLLDRFVNASNARMGQLRAAFLQSSRRLAASRRLSIVLYLLGSILVLFGTVLTKLV